MGLPARGSLAFALALAAAAAAACDQPSLEEELARLPPPPDSVPQALARGSSLWVTHCASCHGEDGRGAVHGPPLVHPVYRRSHHADASFRLAVTHGVRAHHWRYGDMPPVPAVGADQVDEVTEYIRWLQREAGLDR